MSYWFSDFVARIYEYCHDKRIIVSASGEVLGNEVTNLVIISCRRKLRFVHIESSSLIFYKLNSLLNKIFIFLLFMIAPCMVNCLIILISSLLRASKNLRRLLIQLMYMLQVFNFWIDSRVQVTIFLDHNYYLLECLSYWWKCCSC